LWTLEGLHQFETPGKQLSGVPYRDEPGGPSKKVKEALNAGLKHPSTAVQRAAIMVAPRDEIPHWERVAAQKGDVEPQSLLSFFLAASECPPDALVGNFLAVLVRQNSGSWDRWVRDAAICAAARNDDFFLPRIIAGEEVSGPAKTNAAILEIVRRVATHHALGTPKDVISLLAEIDPRDHSPIISALLEGLSTAWPTGDAPSLDNSEKRALQNLMANLDSDNQARLLLLAQKWRRADLFPTGASALADSLMKTLKDPSAEIPRRSAAATKLIALRDRPETVQVLLEQINELSPPDLSSELIDALAKSRNPQTGAALVQHLPRLTPAARRLQIANLLRRTEWSSALLDSIEGGKLPPSELATEQWAELKSNPDSRIAHRAQALAGGRGAVTADRAAVVQKLLPAASKPGDPHRGKEVFDTSCAVCHSFNGQGGKVGPNLTGIGSREAKEILIDILDPNRSVEANYRSWTVSTGDETFAGRLESETQTTVEILDSTGQKHVIQRKDIKQMNTSGISIMPNGFESLPESDLSALLAYLATPATETAVSSQPGESARK